MLNNSDGPGYFFFDEHTELIDSKSIISSVPAKSGPATAKYLKFANFLDLIVYRDDENQIWISDIKAQNIHPILMKKDKAIPYYYMVWSPDDLHVMIIPSDQEGTRMIYHLQTGELEPWNFQCDRVAVSPKTGKMATWCPSIEAQDKRFAVLEWEDEIWYSTTPPIHELVKLSGDETWLGMYEILGWSSDGEMIAYYDPNDPDGFFYVASAQGIIYKTLPGTAYWLSPLYKKLWYLYDKPIEWSENNRKILIFARGTKTQSCPSTRFDEQDTISIDNDACWQVLDVEKGEITWQFSDILPEIISKGLVSNLYPPNPADYKNAALSANGQRLVLSGLNYLNPHERNTLIVDLDQEAIVGSYFFISEEMRWGQIPTE